LVLCFANVNAGNCEEKKIILLVVIFINKFEI
jgi:hypothetical protein